MESDEYDSAVFVACKQELLVGVIVFGHTPVMEENLTAQIYSLGVAREFQNRRIGTDLKMASLSEIAAVSPGCTVLSEVHKNNLAMRRVNDRIGVTTDPKPRDEYLISAIKPERSRIYHRFGR